MWIGAANMLASQASALPALVGFLVGFSEPFFLGTVDKLTAAGATTPAKSLGGDVRPKRTLS